MIQTVDIAVVSGGKLLLIRRAKPPFMDKLVLPGGHVEASDASLAAAAARELREEVGLDLPPERLRFLMTLDAPDRDPRPGRRVSSVFVAGISATEAAGAAPASDAVAVTWRPLAELKPEEVGFDHWLAVEKLGVS